MGPVGGKLCTPGEDAAFENLLLHRFRGGRMRWFQHLARREVAIPVDATDYSLARYLPHPI